MHSGHFHYLFICFLYLFVSLLLYKGYLDPVLKLKIKNHKSLKQARKLLCILSLTFSLGSLILLFVVWDDINQHGMIFSN
jgi:hypothetical protein